MMQITYTLLKSATILLNYTLCDSRSCVYSLFSFVLSALFYLVFCLVYSFPALIANLLILCQIASDEC